MEENKLKNYLHLHFIVFIWGFTAILGALISIDSVPLVWYRMCLAVVFIAIYFFFQKTSFKVDKKGLLKFAISGVIIAVHWITFFEAIKVSNVSVALVTMSTGAFFAALIEPLFFKRKIAILEIVLGMLIIGGLYLIFNFESQYTLGIIYALISAFLSALFAVLNGIFIKKYEAKIISFYQLLFGALAITLYLIFTHKFTVDFFQIPTNDWLYLLLLSSICTAYAFIASVKVMKYITPYTVMLTINLEPVYAIILALIIFGEKEQMSAAFYYGAVVILLIVLANGILKNRSEVKKKFTKK
ncbi:DMT family transporter [Tenacibaculum finnmarkense]|uniref:Permease n=1 Tax=Tenacibaculum finnmarkense genomovar ulcerans TaxID=2781388 RepID=A0A2I2MAY2_9FLAO|nr:EamA family transporter [Tenacibaculum finnmarkense]ALU75030.1 permease [Tenacibaculum dicentrarchi]MBE7645797.1 EamA family transporter [Tenacibaculum finnmarkense genomovar ulcerans]MBE7647856.1 EamA family transporter [Tenacibaculum finnmarkense genomovar ulcerans]MBE7697739.1 EamA family transporter [Tenacibaculum finnmarkense genomovar ulcerans]MCD8399946.1 DMT family transporter [Tenacibaculum finnmarkense genomovar ulcerans]